MRFSLYLACLLAAGLLAWPGCSPGEPVTKPVVDAGGHGHDHDHGHGHGHHGHEDGPHGGILHAVTDAGIKLEVVPKYGDNLVTFYSYDVDGKTEKKIKADMLTASRKVTDVESWEIPAVDAADGMASRFELVDEKLAIAMKTTGATISVDIDGKKHSVEIPKDAHAH